jgi:tetratricopeptide (TPR) repeat protein
MPSEKSTQSPQNQQTSDHNVEIITPLKVRSHSDQPDSSRPFRLTVMPILFLLIGLAVMAAGGFVFIRHLSKHPVNVSEETHRTEKSEVDAQKKQVPDATRTTKLQVDPLTPSAPVTLDQQQTMEPQQTINPAKRALEKQKAEKLDAVNRLVESGKTHEKNDRFAFAHTDYQEALKLDPESKDAQKAVNRVKERIVGQQFQKLMSDGLTAYHDGRYQSARIKLSKAKSFRPDSREVQNALLQVDEAIRLAKIEKLRQKAMTAEQTEDWEKALRSYLAVLKIDPNISFAVQGKERALKQIQIGKRITFFLQKPDAMESNPQLQNAVLVIEEAESLQPRGPRLSERLDELKALVDAARTPVKVMIESDNHTEVAVYKVGKLGRFTTRELSLRPGIYTVVGSRDGHKDVRQKIIVKPRQKALRVTVICRNKV